MTPLLLAQDFSQWGDLIRSLGPSGILGVILYFVARWWREDVRDLRAAEKAANDKTDEVQEARISDLKGVLKDLSQGGGNHG